MRWLRPAVVTFLLAALGPADASASDFWDEVRTPGLRAWRHHVAQARAALRAHRWNTARHAGERAIEALAHRAAGHVLRGRALGELGRPEDAVKAFERALELDPAALGDAENGAHAAELCARTGSYGVAARILERVLGQMPVSARRYELYVLYGDVLLSRGEAYLRESILAYREALRRSQSVDARAGLGLALALRRQGERLEADDVARQAVARGRVDSLISGLPVPASEKAARRAVARGVIGDHEGAVRAWRSAAQSKPWQRHARAELRKLDDRPASGRRGGRDRVRAGTRGER